MIYFSSTEKARRRKAAHWKELMRYTYNTKKKHRFTCIPKGFQSRNVVSLCLKSDEKDDVLACV